MDLAAPNTSAVSPPDPPQDHSVSTVPHNITVLLHAVRILLGYGRHLMETVHQRAANPNFNALAACFGTANLATIFAQLNRGLLRAAALERVLLARAATGKDIEFVEHRACMPQSEAAEAPLPLRTRAARPSRLTGSDDPELFIPTMEDLERQARRRPIGRTIQDICLDLAVVPGFCHSAFWSELFDIITYFGGSIPKLMHQKTRRREAFAHEQDRKSDANWDWLNPTRDALRQILGFFIGEPPINPLDPAAAIATAPP